MGGDIALYMLALLIFLILLGVHIGVSLAICSALGVWLMLGSMEAALAILGNTAYEAVRKGCLCGHSAVRADGGRHFTLRRGRAIFIASAIVR